MINLNPAAQLPLLCIAFFYIAEIPASLAQQWPAGHLPQVQPIPQYRSQSHNLSYPLFDGDHRQAPQQQSSLPRNQFNAHQESLSSPPNPLSTTRPTQPLPHSSGYLQYHLDEPAVASPPAGEQSSALPPHTRSEIGLVPPASSTQPKPQKRYSPQMGPEYLVFRDLNPIPVDPRKACNPCTHPPRRGLTDFDWPGKKGNPYQDREPGGCRCGKMCFNSGSIKRDQFSINWPAPFSVIREKRGRGLDQPPSKFMCKYLAATERLSEFKLIDYQRTDNGYCGPGSDPFGCLGEQRSLFY